MVYEPNSSNRRGFWTIWPETGQKLKNTVQNVSQPSSFELCKHLAKTWFFERPALTRAHPRSEIAPARAHPRSPALTRALQKVRFWQKVRFKTAFWQSLSNLTVLGAFAWSRLNFQVEVSKFRTSLVKKHRTRRDASMFAVIFVFAKFRLRIGANSLFRCVLFEKWQFSCKQPFPLQIHPFTRMVLWDC